jgi:hypothetical protein
MPSQQGTLLNSGALLSSKISSGTTALSLITSTVALVTPTPPSGIAPMGASSGYLFDIPLTSRLQLQAQITDHFAEDNVALQDHIAIEPVRITLTGIVSELVFSKSKLQKYLEQTIARLEALGILQPGIGASAQLYINQAASLYDQTSSAIEQLTDAFDTLTGGSGGRNKQQRCYDNFVTWFKSRTLLSVETPWVSLTNMSIENFTVEQDEVTQDQTTVTVNFKQINTASTAVVPGNLMGRSVSQMSSPVNGGITSGLPAPESVLSGAFNHAGQVPVQ